ncbi:MAG: FHA domain-containing protein [bacterium]
MNWKRFSLKKLWWQTALLGAVTGVWAASFFEFGWRIGEGLGGRGWAAALAGAGMGLVLGAGLGSLDALIDRYWNRAVRAAAVAALAGAAIGGGGCLAVELALPGGAAGWSHSLALAPVWGLLAATGGLASGFGAHRLGKGFRRAVVGFFAGAGAGIPLAFVPGAGGAPAFVAGLALWGGLTAWLVFWWEKRLARSWLRLLTGPAEDIVFPLNGHRVTLGSLQSNDIPLVDFQQIFPVHCHLAWDGSRYEIVDNEDGGVVLVNYRQVREQSLKPGDLIKIGTALLQYGEAP